MLTFHSLKVVEIYPEAEDAVGVAFEVPLELRDQYRGLPGQHIVIKTDIDDVENRRTYSLVSSPGEWPLRIVARVHPKGYMSRYLAEQLNAGDYLDVLPPNGSFTPRRVEAGGTYVAFASGCGITPVLAVTRSLLEANDTNRVILFYGNANSGRAMCLEELLGLKDRYLKQLSLHFVMSREPQEVALYNGRIDAARVKGFARIWFTPGEVTEYFVCGPGNMIDDVSGALRALGVEADKIHGEHFTLETTAGTTMGEVTTVGITIPGAAGAGAAAQAGVAAGEAQGEISVEFAEPPVSGTAASAVLVGAAAAGSAPPSGVSQGAGSMGSAPAAAAQASGAPASAAAAGSAQPGAASAGAAAAGSAQPGAASASAAVSSATPTSASPARSDKPAHPSQPDKPALAADESEVTILMDGRRRTFTMRMNDEVVLDAAVRAGLELPFSCRAGVCSTCRTKVVRGEVEMAQNYALEDWEVEQGYVLACQARVKTPALELDYDEK
jgi:ferredoxin-NADP reductase/ferredoxin